LITRKEGISVETADNTTVLKTNVTFAVNPKVLFNSI